jgi:hypothetical protein
VGGPRRGLIARGGEADVRRAVIRARAQPLAGFGEHPRAWHWQASSWTYGRGGGTGELPFARAWMDMDACVASGS